MIHTDGIPTIANHGSERLLARPAVDPATTRDCDGYPGLAAADDEGEAELRHGGCCGDPGDCGACGS